ncbi:MAG: hypothetical protein E7240_08950 [Lachnospiraceae bacterium]|nr:hypothetical protein [Lachnospiraceae bacterium]
MKFYTVLSNIFAGLTAVLTTGFMLFSGGAGTLPYWVGVLKYSSAVSVGLTFLVVMVFLGPRMSYPPLFKGPLLCLHAVGPLLTILSFAVNPMIPRMGFSASFLAVIPTVFYGAGYILNILRNGLGEGENTNDWYGFAIGGIKGIPVAFAVILLVTWGIALLLRMV